MNTDPDSPLTPDEARQAAMQSVAARRYIERRERAIAASVTSDPVVHMVVPGNVVAGGSVCRNALVAGTDPNRVLRDLAVFIPGGVEHHQGIPYDSDPAEPDAGTWHFRDWCPELGKDAPARQALARSGRSEDPCPECGRTGTCKMDCSRRQAGTSWGTAEVMLTGSRSVTGRALILGQGVTGSSREFIEAARSAKADDPVWITDGGGFVLAVITPAGEYVPPGQCNCKNCPWNGNHETPGERHHD